MSLLSIVSPHAHYFRIFFERLQVFLVTSFEIILEVLQISSVEVVWIKY